MSGTVEYGQVVSRSCEFWVPLVEVVPSGSCSFPKTLMRSLAYCSFDFVSEPAYQVAWHRRERTSGLWSVSNLTSASTPVAVVLSNMTISDEAQSSVSLENKLVVGTVAKEGWVVT